MEAITPRQMPLSEVIGIVINMLNNVTVSGKVNLSNLGNAIANLENIQQILYKNENAAPTDDDMMED